MVCVLKLEWKERRTTADDNHNNNNNNITTTRRRNNNFKIMNLCATYGSLSLSLSLSFSTPLCIHMKEPIKGIRFDALQIDFHGLSKCQFECDVNKRAHRIIGYEKWNEGNCLMFDVYVFLSMAVIFIAFHSQLIIGSRLSFFPFLIEERIPCELEVGIDISSNLHASSIKW